MERCEMLCKIRVCCIKYGQHFSGRGASLICCGSGWSVYLNQTLTVAMLILIICIINLLQLLAYIDYLLAYAFSCLCFLIVT